MTATKLRNAARIFTAPRAIDGHGVELRRAFPGAAIQDFDPFLLLDRMGPMDLVPGDTRGFPPHPHRGFETVTYLLAGEIEHRDSWGNHGTLRPGDVQWMTAGSGLVHSETPGQSVVSNGGRLHGFQLWVNLPRRDKMIAPRYQDTSSQRIPVARNSQGTVTARVIAGQALGVKGVIETRIPILYLHLTLAPGATHVQEIPNSENALAFVIEGQARFGDAQAGPAQVALFDRSADALEISSAGSAPLSLLLIAGEPIGEPVARYGPFVMNTRDEIQQAVDDFRAGRMGVL